MIYIMAHRSRQKQARTLAAKVGASIIFDPQPKGQPSALRTHVSVLRTAVHDEHAAGCFVVLQDDAIPCPSFVKVVARVWEARPGNLISLYVGSAHGSRGQLQRALHRCSRFVDLPRNQFVPTVGIIWPVEYAESFLAWVDRVKPAYGWDDEAIMEWRISQARKRQAPSVVGTIPSIVKHDNRPGSVMPHADHGYRDAYCDWRSWKGYSDWREGWA